MVKQVLLIALLALPGVLAATLQLESLLPADAIAELPMPIWAVQLLSLLQSSVLVGAFALLGLWASKAVGLRFFVSLTLWPVLSAVVAGVVTAVMVLGIYLWALPYLPAELINAPTLPWYTKLLYGGITEEVIARWGILALLAWGLTLVLPKRLALLIAALLSSLAFALLHFPYAASLGASFDLPLITYLISANMIFALAAAWLFIRFSLVHAMMAHMVFHLTLIVLA